MSSVPQVASGGGELSSLDLFGCRTNSPPMSVHQPSALPQPAVKGAIHAPIPANPTEVGATSVVAERSGNNEARHEKSKPPESKAVESPASQSPTLDLKRDSGCLKATCQTIQRTALNRIAKVREQQGISERTMARRLGVDVKRYRQFEDPCCDLTLSQLNAIQQALEVPISDLLEERQGLSRPVEERAKLLKVMKTAVALRDAKINARADRMAQMLCDQLIDLMPELAEVSGWPQFGARRGISAVGKALQQPIDTSNIHFQE